MDQTVDQLAAHIDHTRQRLGANLHELEEKVEAATDWREHLRSRPYLVLGAGCLGGMLLGAALGPAGRRRATTLPEAPMRLVGGRSSSVRAQAVDFWDSAVSALVGVAATRLKDYIGDLVPGFEDEYAAAAQRTSARRMGP
jgi:hypothetical protein